MPNTMIKPNNKDEIFLNLSKPAKHDVTITLFGGRSSTSQHVTWFFEKDGLTRMSLINICHVELCCWQSFHHLVYGCNILSLIKRFSAVLTDELARSNS